MDVGSIASLSMYMSQTKLMQDLGTAALDMVLDSAQSQGISEAAMMELSVNPDIGSNIDLSV